MWLVTFQFFDKINICFSLSMTQCTVYSSWSSNSAYEKTETKRVEIEDRKHFADYLLMQLNPVTSHSITNQAKKTTSGVNANFCFFSLSATREHRCAQCPPFLSLEMFDSGNIGRELNQKFFQLNYFLFRRRCRFAVQLS